MSKVKDKAIVSAAQASTAYSQIDSFSHLYDRGGNLTVNGKPSYSVDQAATQLLRDGAAYQDKDSSGKIWNWEKNKYNLTQISELTYYYNGSKGSIRYK